MERDSIQVMDVRFACLICSSLTHVEESPGLFALGDAAEGQVDEVRAARRANRSRLREQHRRQEALAVLFGLLASPPCSPSPPSMLLVLGLVVVVVVVVVVARWLDPRHGEARAVEATERRR